MLANMASSLILHKRINTTLAKAKELRTFVEPLITVSKVAANQADDKVVRMNAYRLVLSRLRNEDAVSELFKNVSSKIVDRNGGYTRILKTGIRLGDNSKMCMMELVDFNESYNPSAKVAKAAPKATRRSRSKKVSAKPAEESNENTEAKSE